MPQLRGTWGDPVKLKTWNNVITCFQVLIYVDNCVMALDLFANEKQFFLNARGTGDL